MKGALKLAHSAAHLAIMDTKLLRARLLFMSPTLFAMQTKNNALTDSNSMFSCAFDETPRKYRPKYVEKDHPDIEIIPCQLPAGRTFSQSLIFIHHFEKTFHNHIDILVSRGSGTITLNGQPRFLQ